MAFARFAFTVPWCSLCLLAACGGSTTNDSLPGGAGGGTSGSAGSATAGSGTAGRHGSGTAGSGTAGSGTAGSGTSGSGTSGSSGGDFTSCGMPGDCALRSASCCGQCGAATVADKAGINKAKLGDYMQLTCGGDVGCPACFMETSTDLFAVCRASQCSPVEVSKDPMSACNVDADCELHVANDCCECGTQPAEKYIALAKTGVGEYHANVCGPGGCALDCAGGGPPSGIAPACDPATKHCKVVKATPATACPPSIPKNGGACTPPPTGICEYGTSVNISCRTTATCANGAWSVGLTGCPPTPGPGQAGCPKDTKVTGSDCTGEGLVCDMTGGASCLCTSCTGPCGINPTWHCAEAPGGGCPKSAPNVGQPCDKPQTCSYGVACTQTGATRICKGGVWTDETLACPL